MIYDWAFCVIKKNIFVQGLIQKWYIIEYFMLLKIFFSLRYNLKVRYYWVLSVIKKTSIFYKV